MEDDLMQIDGIGQATADVLDAHSIGSISQLAALTVAELTAVPGFGPIRAARILEQAMQLAQEKAAPVRQEKGASTGANESAVVKKKKKKKKKKGESGPGKKGRKKQKEKPANKAKKGKKDKTRKKK